MGFTIFCHLNICCVVITTQYAVVQTSSPINAPSPGSSVHNYPLGNFLGSTKAKV